VALISIRAPENVGENHDISFEASFTLRLAGHMGGGTLFKVGGAQVQVKKAVEKFCGLNWQL